MKKTILFIIFIIAVLFFILSNQSISSDWKYIGTIKEGDVYLESDNARQNGSVKTFRYMYVDKSGEVSEVKCSMDCKRKTVTFIEHWEPGTSLPVIKLSRKPNWIEFPPDSVWDKFYKSLCSETEIANTHLKEFDSYKNIINKVLPLKPQKIDIIKESTGEIENKFIFQKVSLDKRQQNEVIKYGEKPFIFAVQVGAFKYSSNAQALAKRLQGKGYRVEVTPLEKRGNIFFRVRVGRFTNIQEAENLSQEIRKIEGLQTFIALL